MAFISFVVVTTIKISIPLYKPWVKPFEKISTLLKKKENRFVAIPDTLFKTQEEIPRALHNDHVFSYKGKPLKSIRASLKKACETVAMDITGHSTREMFDRYNTVDEAERTEAVKRMESFLFNQDDEDKVNKKS